MEYLIDSYIKKKMINMRTHITLTNMFTNEESQPDNLYKQMIYW